VPEAASAAPQPLLGQTLRRIRTEQGLKMEEVAERTGISRSFIALVEAGKSDISIGRLLRLADLFDVPLTDLVPHGDEERMEVVRSDDRMLIESSAERVRTWILASVPGGAVTSLLATFEEGAEAGEFRRHHGIEFVMVLAGQVTVRFADDSATVLDDGDSACFDAQRLHAYANTGDGVLTLLSVAVDPKAGSS
jgi:transcriptional regulator with XRE-family HTH domain